MSVALIAIISPAGTVPVAAEPAVAVTPFSEVKVVVQSASELPLLMMQIRWLQLLKVVRYGTSIEVVSYTIVPTVPVFPSVSKATVQEPLSTVSAAALSTHKYWSAVKTTPATVPTFSSVLSTRAVPPPEQSAAVSMFQEPNEKSPSKVMFCVVVRISPITTVELSGLRKVRSFVNRIRRYCNASNTFLRYRHDVTVQGLELLEIKTIFSGSCRMQIGGRIFVVLHLNDLRIRCPIFCDLDFVFLRGLLLIAQSQKVYRFLVSQSSLTYT
eukprot:TRINITY_DN6127_c0_g1_i13.p1 TRINITY_DN6127_c0_g1~~TRINITY_DN6127_c0_g1_i13.p1  ORF type:complete len:270 (+),score=-11.18 TRINITY_DN6127_c0_g1_i13:247-1056(+)